LARLHELEGVHNRSLHGSFHLKPLVVILEETQIHQVPDISRRDAIQCDAGDIGKQLRITANGRVVARHGLHHVEHGRFMHIFNGFKFGQHCGILRRRDGQNCERGRAPAASALHQFKFFVVSLAFSVILSVAGNAQAATPLEMLVLGSGGPGATGRAAAAYLLLLDGKPRILVDAGPGSFARLGEAGEAIGLMDIVLLTHLHIDHAGELPALLKARAVSNGGPITFKIWGPDGAAASGDNAYFPSTRRFMDLLFGPQGAFAYLKDFASPITLETHDIATHGTTSTLPRVIYEEPKLTISAIAGHHGDAPAVIYRIDYAGKSITFSGDIDAKGLPALQRIARDTDILVFNTVVLDPPGSAPILYTLHTPPKKIGELARDVGAHHLLLSHLSPSTIQMHDAVMDSIHQAYSGKVQAAQDGMRMEP
jgi:ribonuclease BN (tRNA processing enzyme)